MSTGAVSTVACYVPTPSPCTISIAVFENLVARPNPGIVRIDVRNLGRDGLTYYQK